MKKRGFFVSSLSQRRHKIIFYEKRAPLLEQQNFCHKKHTRERRCFPFRLTPLRRRRFLRSERPSRTRACPGACESANDVSLFTRNFVSFFFSFFLISFLPSFGCVSGPGKTKRFGCGPSLSWGVHREWGSIGPIAKDESGREGGGLCCCCCCLVGRTLLLGVVSKEAGVLIPSSLTII